MIKTLYSLWKNRKAMDIPGWAYVIALIIGLFVILFAIWIAAKSGSKQSGFLEQI
jgi:hypothetical protein